MNATEHWDNVYTTKAPSAVSWYRPHLDVSLRLIEKATVGLGASIIDVGGGESTLVDDLLDRAYQNITVLDISARAIEVTKSRLGDRASSLTWLNMDITVAHLPARTYDVWHDRAVFHFLTEVEQRSRYVENVARSVRAGGHVIVGAFGPQGPQKCSGLDVVRYDAPSLHREFGPHFRLIESSTELHQTPFGSTQQFLYCDCAVGE